MQYETADGRYVKVGDDEWWDTTGVEIVDLETVHAYIGPRRIPILARKVETATLH